MDLSFSKLRASNVVRCREAYHPLDDWSPTDWACAAAGEMGEACNFVKKLRRGAQGADRAVLTQQIARELADTVIYIDLLAARLQIDLGAAVVEKFNRTSQEIKSKVLLCEEPGAVASGGEKP